jgi:hypothetical protein
MMHAMCANGLEVVPRGDNQLPYGAVMAAAEMNEKQSMVEIS